MKWSFQKKMTNIRFLLTLTTIIDRLQVGYKNKEKIPHKYSYKKQNRYHQDLRSAYSANKWEDKRKRQTENQYATTGRSQNDTLRRNETNELTRKLDLTEPSRLCNEIFKERKKLGRPGTKKGRKQKRKLRDLLAKVTGYKMVALNEKIERWRARNEFTRDTIKNNTQ